MSNNISEEFLHSWLEHDFGSIEHMYPYKPETIEDKTGYRKYRTYSVMFYKKEDAQKLVK